MSDLPDPQDVPADKRIIFGARKPTDGASPLTGIPLFIEAPFPHERTLHWWPADLPFELNAGNTAVVISQEVLTKVNEHVGQTLDRELGGFLLGNRYCCPNTNCDYVIIDQYTPAKYTESSEVRLNFTHDTWAQLSDELSGKFLGKLLIGWYHSHPRLDVFLSSHDLEIQTERFPEPWMVALVLEPEKHLGGFFCSRDGRVKPTTPVNFFELLERNSRESVIEWKNYEPASATPVLNANTPEVQTSSPEMPANIDVSPIENKRTGRLVFVAVVVLLLAAAIAVGVTNRKRIKEWLQNQNIVSVSPQPSRRANQSMCLDCAQARGLSR